MTHAQKDFDQTLGMNGDSTIAESGSLLTAFCNLLERFGHNINPETLDNVFVDFGIYLPIGGDVRNQLAMSSVTTFDSTLGVYETGTGVPPHHNAIVRMEYDSVLTGGRVTTFALVVDNVAGTIIDSFDGKLKSWAVYGGPVEWFVYKRFDAMPTTPLRPAQEPAQAAPETFTVHSTLGGHTALESAQAKADNDFNVKPGEYYVFDVSDDEQFVNVTATVGQPGAWISVADNVPVERDEGEQIPVRVVPPNPLAWQKTYSPYLGVVEMVATEDAVAHDHAGGLDDRDVTSGSLVPVAGEFIKDNVTYARTKNSAANGQWYGIPITSLRRTGDEDEDLDRAIDDLLRAPDDELRFELGDDRPTARDRAIKVGATLDGKLQNVKKAISFRK